MEKHHKKIITLIFILLIIGVLFFMGYFYFQEHRQNINTNWEDYRCEPYVIPFAGVLGPNGTSSKENFKYCTWRLQKDFFDILMHPFTSIIELIVGIINLFGKSIQDIRSVINYIREAIKNIAQDIYLRLKNTYARLAFLFNAFIKTMHRLMNFLYYAMLSSIAAFYTLASIWNGPFGGFIRFFCFGEKTPLIVVNSNKKMTKIPIKDIQLYNELPGNNKILGKLTYAYLHPRTKDPLNKIFKVGKETHVTQDHLVLNDDLYYQRVRNYALGRPLISSEHKNFVKNNSQIICLITTNGQIITPDGIFSDYFEVNGNKKYIYLIYRLMIDHINNGNPLLEPTPHPKFNESLFWGLHGDTKIKMFNQKVKKIKDIVIGDRIENGRYIVGTNELYCEKLYQYKDLKCSGTLVVLDKGSWKPIYMCDESNVIKENNLNQIYNIVVDGNYYATDNNIQCRDFEITEDISLHHLLDKYSVERR